MEKIYQNYHKHTSYSNVYTKDSPLVTNDYLVKMKEIGGKQIYSTVEHGFQSPYFRVYDELEEFNRANETDIKFIFGAEVYWVKDRLSTDRSNCHMVLLARNEKGRKALNKAISIANKTGYYYKPRLDLELILGLPKDDVFVTTACLAFWNKYEDMNEVVLKLNEHFTHFYLEVQSNHTERQVEVNKNILALSVMYNIPLIAGTDSHVIDNSQLADRDDLLKSSGIAYPEEDGWFMDFPSYDTFYNRFVEQGVLSEEQITKAIDNTNIILDFDDIILNRTMKMPTLYPNLNQTEKDKIFIQTIFELWDKEKEKIPQELHKQYTDEIVKEMNEILGCAMCDYFLFNKKVIELGIEKYGGELTQSGRGSNVAMYLNKLLGFTNIDCISAPIDMYSERFLTKERVLESKTPPDEDYNVTDRIPFLLAQKEILGDDRCYDLISFGRLHLKSAFKMYARANDVDAQVANDVSKQIEKYEKAVLYAEDDEKDDIDMYDYIDKEEFGHIIEGCQRYLGIVDNRKSHPCFTKNELITTDKGYKKIKAIVLGDKVLTHNNKFEKVMKLMDRESNDIYNLKAMGSLGIEVTGNHPMLVGRRIKPKNKMDLKVDWIPVSELKKQDMMAVAINNNSIIPCNDFDLPFDNKDFWWIIGRFIGDGWYEEFARLSGKCEGDIVKRTIICCGKGKNELEDIKSKIGNMFEYRVQEETTTYKIIIKGKDIHEYVKTFGKYAYGKRFTNDILDLPIELLKVFLEGYFSADGHLTKKGYQSLKTVSKELALGVVACVNKAYHMPCGITYIAPKVEYIEGRKVNSKEKYDVKFKYVVCKKDRAFYKDGYIWCPYYSKEKLDKTDTVYNIEVENDHSYTVNNLVVHNCGSIVASCDIEEEVGIVLCKSETTKKEVLTALIESITIDAFGWLKNDFLIVDSTRIINSVYRRIGMQPIEINDLLKIIKDDKKVWDIYANGHTQCINQCEKEKTTQKMMIYKARNIVELTQFIAGIRPSFKSLYSYFEKRQRYQYNIKALDTLLQNQYCDSSFILFQEDLMKILAFAGFAMKDTYNIIKAISKKKKKKIADVKPKFIATFAQKIIETGDADNEEDALILAQKVWGIVEDFSSYGFNSPHGFSYAIDSVTQAWQKANYPYEFYEVVLQRFTDKGEKTKVSLIKKEMIHFNINLKPMKFRDDNRGFTAYKEKGYITQPLNSVKNMSKDAPQILYDMKDIELESFVDLLSHMMCNTKLNKKHIEILIKLDYFSEYGDINYLLGIYTKHQELYKKTYVEKTKIKRTIEIKEFIETLTKHTTSIIDRIKFEIELVGYTDLKDSSFDEKLVMVTNLEFNQYGTPFVTLYNISVGSTLYIKVNKTNYNKKPFEINDMLYLVLIKNDKKFWIKDRDEYENVLHNYRMVVE
ncbi:PHP domain-containing protein [Clostridium tagluense]|uniref:DOD-type homing endonuclease domain-containing protein n=1 Tax=Clostridium tagluense TaxID=360422 RepID=A0A401UQ79_9CLOT|nr:PHP domain-containing protein [Clostridium tagluense]GCD11713.1 hypothetical protein Ctaglu_33360 [Clostridium tagluense]